MKHNLHLFPPLALKLKSISVIKANINGPATAINGQSKSPSNLSARRTYINTHNIKRYT